MIRNEKFLQQLFAAGMQLCWIYAIFSFINIMWYDGKMQFVPLVAGFLIGFGISAVLKKIPSKRYTALVIILTGIIYFFFLLNIPWEIWLDFFNGLWKQMSFDFPQQISEQCLETSTRICMGIILWVVGWRQGRIQMDLKGLYAEFQLGFGLLFFVFVIGFLSRIHFENSILIVCVFFALALCGLSISKMYENHESGIGISGNTRLVYSVFSLIFVFFLAAIILFAVNPKMVEMFLNLVVFIKDQFLNFMNFLVWLFPAQEKDILRFAEFIKQLAERKTSNVTGLTTSKIKSVLEFGYLALFSGLGLTILWNMSRMFLNFLKRSYTSASQINYESLHGAFKADLIFAFKQFYHYLIKLCAWISLVVFKLILKFGFFSGQDAVWDIYEKMLKWSSKKGFKRQNYQTQYEHINQLIYKFPQTRSSLLYLTGLYTKQRYGNIGPSTQEEDQMRHVWCGLKKIKLRIKKKGGRK